MEMIIYKILIIEKMMIVVMTKCLQFEDNDVCHLGTLMLLDHIFSGMQKDLRDVVHMVVPI